MNAHDIIKRFGKEAVGIIIAKVDFLREWKFNNVLDVPDIGGLDALFIKPLFIERHAGIDPLADLLKSLALQLRKFRS
jgi:hypothetical protein